MKSSSIKKLAMIITANCTRNSEVSDLVEKGILKEDILLNFNQQVSNRIYTFLVYLLTKPAHEYQDFMQELVKHFPEGWRSPKLEKSIIHK